jgi:hypothetical protein
MYRACLAERFIRIAQLIVELQNFKSRLWVWAWALRKQCGIHWFKIERQTWRLLARIKLETYNSFTDCNLLC